MAPCCAGIRKRFAGRNAWLLPNHTFAMNFLYLFITVRLNGHAAFDVLVVAFEGNLNAGGKTRLSGMIAGLLLLIILLGLGPIASQIPAAERAGFPPPHVDQSTASDWLQVSHWSCPH